MQIIRQLDALLSRQITYFCSNNKFFMAKRGKIISFEELVDLKFGQPGNPSRDEFEQETRWHELSDLLRSQRLELGLTQSQLAQKIGSSKTYISKIENGKSDMLLSTLFKLVEQGYGRKLSLIVE